MTLHFGLGKGNQVKTIEVRWPNGLKRILRKPELNRYHLMLTTSGVGVPEILGVSLEVPSGVPRGQELLRGLLSNSPEHADDMNGMNK